jgi:serine/threonine protein kinase/WD40 repeat protein
MSDSSADRDPLDRLAEEFVARYRAGQRPSLSEYAARLPGRADEVRDLFPALVEMEQLKPVTADHTCDFAPAAAPSDPQRVGEFRILRRVGVGGMGVVFEAVQESLGRHVALKLLPADALADPKRLERFKREAKAAARLHHTNIVPVFGTGEADGRHYYAMQFIAGHPLDAVIDEVRRLKEKSAAAPRAVSEVAVGMVTGAFAAAPAPSAAEGPPVVMGGAAEAGSSPSFSGSLPDGGRSYWATVARVGAQAADALAYAHAQGVLHRDVKPANLLLDLQGTVWVTDFGLAKSADADDLTHAGDVVGTLRYLAPERFEGAGDHRADVYALGLTLYELLTLRPAFRAENRAKLVQEVTAAAPPPPRSVNPAIPRDLETVVLKAIQRDPALRYPSAAELADDLRRYVEDRPIRARRATAAEQAWRWCRRNPAVASLIAAVLLVLTAGVVVASIFAVRADAERANAVAAGEKLRRTNYAVSMNLIQAAWEANNVGRVVELLHRQKPQPGESDLRGFEWHYWRRRCHGDLRTVQLPVGLTIHHPALSPDGTHLAAVVQEGGRLAVKVWDIASGTETLRLAGPVILGLLDERWDNLAFSPDGKRLAAFMNPSGGNPNNAINSDGEVRVWDCADGRELFKAIVKAAATPGHGFRFSPDGNRLGAVVVRMQPPNFRRQVCELIVWDVAAGREMLHLPCRSSGFYGLSFSPDGSRLVTTEWSGPEVDATSDTDYAIKILDVADGKEVRALRAPVGFAYHMLFSPDGTRIAMSTVKKGAGGELRIYDAATLAQVKAWKMDSGWDVQIAFSPDGRRLAGCGLDAAVCVWRVDTAELEHTCKGHTAPAMDVIFSRDGTRLVSADSAGTVKFWDVTPNALPPAQQDEPDVFVAGAVAPDLSRVALCKSSIAAPPPGAPTPQRVIRVLGRDGKEIHRIEVAAEIVNSLDFSRDGGRLAAVLISQREKTSRVVVWDTACAKELCSMEGQSGKDFSAFNGWTSFSPDGSRLVARFQMTGLENGTNECKLKVWDAATWRELCAIDGGGNTFTNADISPDNKWLVSVGAAPDATGQVKLWDVATGRELANLETQGRGLSDESISPGGKLIAVAASLTKSVHVFDVATRKEVFVLKGLAGPVEGVTFSPDGRRIAASTSTQGGDQIIKLWDAATGEEVLTLRHEAGASSYPWGFSADGTRLFALNRYYRRRDNPLHVWDARPLPEDR